MSYTPVQKKLHVPDTTQTKMNKENQTIIHHSIEAKQAHFVTYIGSRAKYFIVEAKHKYINSISMEFKYLDLGLVDVE